VKQRLERGQWGAWLATEFHWSSDTAENLMSAARLALQNPKFSEFEDRIARSAMYLLASDSTPEPAREEAIRRAEAGEEIGVKDAREIVQAAKAEQATSSSSPSYSEAARLRQQRQAIREANTDAALEAPAPSALNQRQRPDAYDVAAAEAEYEANALIGQLGGQYIGMTDDGRYRVVWADVGATPVPYRLDELRRLAAEEVPPAPPAQLLDQVGRQPYGAKGADRWQPIAPHVLIIEQRTHRYGPPPLVRAATIYDTPTTVRVRRPDGKEETQAQHKVWAVADDAAWSEIEAARDAFAAALSSFADVLRDLGRYDRRLAANGGIKQVPDGPLCPSVARADDPDANNQSSWWLSAWHVPRLERTTVERHTAKMLASADIGSYMFAQHESWLLADDAAWARVSAAHQAIKDSVIAVDALLRRLGTYEDATQRAADGLATINPPEAITAASTSAPVEEILGPITRKMLAARDWQLTGRVQVAEEAGAALVRLYELRTPPMGGGGRNTVWKNRAGIDAIIHAPAVDALAPAVEVPAADEAQAEHRDDDRIGGYIEIEEDDEITVSILADGLTQHAADAVALIADSLRLMARGESHAVETGGLMQLAALLNRATSGHARGTLATILTMIAEDADALATTQREAA